MALNFSKSLVADYDSSSDDEDVPFSETSHKAQTTIPLVSALEMLDPNAKSISNSVFTNPYQQAECYEQAILEKHVKMTVVKDVEVKTKICYKFKKGKCRLGDRCQYLHSNPAIDNQNKTSDTEDNTTEKHSKSSRKRCGIKDDLTPPKKFMKNYNKHK